MREHVTAGRLRVRPPTRAVTDFRVVAVNILGRRGGLTLVWQIHTGPYHRVVAEFTARRDALAELARLVNEAVKS